MKKLIINEKYSMEDDILNRHIGLQILKRMSDRNRSLFMLKQYAGLSYEELARVFNVSVGSVGIMLNRARSEAVKAAKEEGINLEM